MFCKNCGTEMNEEAVFCPKCGKSVNGAISKSDESILDKIKPIGKKYMQKGKKMIQMSFSKEPLEAVTIMAGEESYIGVIFLLVSIMLFALDACLHTVQVANYVVAYIIGKLNSLLESSILFEDLFSSGSAIPIVQMPIKFDMLGSFLLIAMIMCGLEIFEMYLILVLQKKKNSSLINVINVIAIANVPIIIGLIISLVIGFIFPPLVLAVYFFSFMMHIIYVYKGIKALEKLEGEPYYGFIIFVVALGVIVVICSLVFMNMTVNTLLGELQDKISMLEDGINDLLNMF